jgi:hypothetical protein
VICSTKKTLAFGAVLTGAIILFFFDPEKTVWLPKCPFHLLTGLQCPSCGTQRALYHLMHLNLREAISYNPFFVVSAPYALSLIAVTWFDPKDRMVGLKNFCYNPIVIYVYLSLMVAWWIIRNTIGI